MWGKWHLGSDPQNRSPIDFGFDEGCGRLATADEVLWTMQSYFPDHSLTATPYAEDTEVTVSPSPSTRVRRGQSLR